MVMMAPAMINGGDRCVMMVMSAPGASFDGAVVAMMTTPAMVGRHRRMVVMMMTMVRPGLGGARAEGDDASGQRDQQGSDGAAHAISPTGIDLAVLHGPRR
jgi:hypothetical protein